VPDLKKHAERIIHTLREEGQQAYLVGGCVRDLLLGREPADYDVSTDATPEEVMRIFPETYAVGAQFGVVLVPMRGDPAGDVATGDVASNVSTENTENIRRDVACYVSQHPNVVEVATFRSDIGYSDGRHPDQVRFSKSPREDVERRDFTINGLLLDPETDEVIDYVGGQKICKHKSFAPLAVPSCASPKTSCACCAPSALLRASDTPSSRQLLPQSASWLQAFIKSPASVFGMN